MPYEIRGAYVYNTETGEKKNKKPLSKGQAVRYLRALYAAEGRTKTKANYGARAGQTIAGRLGRGGDGQFTSVGSASAKPGAKPGAKPIRDTRRGEDHDAGMPSRPSKGNDAMIAGIQRQLQSANLSPEAKAELEAKLEMMRKTAKPSKPAKGGGGGKGKPEKPVTLSSPLTTALRRLGNGGKIDEEAMQQLVDAGLVKGGVVTAQGRLYIRAYLAGDKAKMSSILAAAKPVAEKSTYGFTVYKAANGTPRWISVTATNFIDRDGEIITHAALKADVDRSYARIARGEAADHGPLRWWHVPDTEIGRCDFRMVTEHALIESGTFTDPAYARVVHKGDQVSLGFTYRPDLRDRHRAFWAIDSFERSICPAGTAINPYTSIGVTHD